MVTKVVAPGEACRDGSGSAGLVSGDVGPGVVQRV